MLLERGRHLRLGVAGHVARALASHAQGVTIVTPRREVLEEMLAPAPGCVVRAVDEHQGGFFDVSCFDDIDCTSSFRPSGSAWKAVSTADARATVLRARLTQRAPGA